MAFRMFPAAQVLKRPCPASETSGEMLADGGDVLRITSLGWKPCWTDQIKKTSGGSQLPSISFWNHLEVETDLSNFSSEAFSVRLTASQQLLRSRSSVWGLRWGSERAGRIFGKDKLSSGWGAMKIKTYNHFIFNDEGNKDLLFILPRYCLFNGEPFGA